ncbi:MAG TPA: HD domain-containing protein [Treponemataceae bacterium]|nr:HD domain-containing protein [Treponemataceae bacterium]
MVTAKFAMKLFEAFSIQRWTDLARPVEFIEMDKAAEKMAVAYILGKFEENNGITIDWDWIISSSLFDLCRKIALCDIKSPVQRMIRSEYPEEYKRLNKWVVDQYKDYFSDSCLYDSFCKYVLRDVPSVAKQTPTEHVLQAAHKYSAYREFEMLSVVNEPDRLLVVEKQLNADIQQYLDLEGLRLLITKQRPYEFVLMIEKLRFQTRWNQTPRVPGTTVLGHSYYVAVLSMLLSRQPTIEMCPKRRFNNFFSALFHDLPEAVTRDIISPVKQATDGFPSIVKKIEDEIVKSELEPLMEPFFADELSYFTNDEFDNRILLEGAKDAMPIRGVSFEDLNKKYNEDVFSPVDGKLVRCADHISAFVEADSSIKHGITSKHLQSGRENILNMYPAGKKINGFSPSDFFADFL